MGRSRDHGAGRRARLHTNEWGDSGGPPGAVAARAVLAAQALQDDADFAHAAVLVDPPFVIPEAQLDAVLAEQLAERKATAHDIQAANPRW